ncbi:hypothetical protein Tco_1122087 [Tanacetum coccineum]|uniref:Uncharacterized protein n=1 Tax=Tanacetum coccineum TaxID=301880 RepID=A0ABQ5J1U5_9ASTR
MDNSCSFRDMMSNLFTLADNEFFNEGVRDESAIKRSWKLLCQSAQQQANALLRFKAPTEEHANPVYAHESLKDMKDYDAVLTQDKGWKERVEELDKEKSDIGNREKYAVDCGNGEMVRRRIINEYLPTFVRRLHQSVEYKWSLGEAFSLAIGKGFIDGISIGRKDPDI